MLKDSFFRYATVPVNNFFQFWNHFICFNLIAHTPSVLSTNFSVYMILFLENYGRIFFFPFPTYVQVPYVYLKKYYYTIEFKYLPRYVTVL